MNEVRHTRSSLGRSSFIQRSLSQASSSGCDSHISPMQQCNRDIKKLRVEILRAEERLQEAKRSIANLHYNIPIKIQNLEKSNFQEIKTQKDFLKNIHGDFEKSLMELHSLTLKQQHLSEDLGQSECRNNTIKDETEKINYSLFKKGQFQGYMEYEGLKLQGPCHSKEIGKLWSDIQEAERELLKWQSIDCHRREPHQRRAQLNEEHMNEHLIRFIKDALQHHILDEGSTRTRQDQLNLLINLFNFDDEEIEAIKQRNPSVTRTRSTFHWDN